MKGNPRRRTSKILLLPLNNNYRMIKFVLLTITFSHNPRRDRTLKRLILTITAIFVFLIPVFTQAASYQVDPDHSSFQFSIRHMTVSNVKGDFKKVRGIVTIDESDINGLKVDLTLDASSVNTDHAKRDEHLGGEDFFHVAKYPTITFISKKVIKVDASRIKVVGDLTLRGVTKEVTVDVEGPTPEVKDLGGNIRRGATGTSKINRKDFGIAWHKLLDNGGWSLGMM